MLDSLSGQRPRSIIPAPHELDIGRIDLLIADNDPRGD